MSIVVGPDSIFLKSERSKYGIKDDMHVNLFVNHDQIKMPPPNELDEEQDGSMVSASALISSLIEHDYNQANIEPKGS